ncbi:hypothetical protein RDWZM_002185 [Blomia tropicalis]|uniref:Band 7 domain-containing protein n=1 Tax=Blomia tropicalis TaxID=40697 RepID=A0A9Q0MHG7_BLOTA|nr:hypothetical protein RDWZM_002185 [Blomia tropicalis]
MEKEFLSGQTTVGENPGICAFLLTIISVILIIATLPFSMFLCIKVVQEYERAVIFRLGRLVKGGAKGPGIFFIIPCIDSYCKVDLRTVSFDVPPQEILSRDSVTVSVDAVVYFRISNATVAVSNVEDYGRSTRLLAATTLRNVLGTKDLSQILSERESISHVMQSSLDEATDPWGVKVERVEIKDVRLPVQLQRAMAAEAEAAREARAKVIAAEGEHKASRALKEAAEVMTHSPAALQLRYLQTLSSIAGEKNSTIVFPHNFIVTLDFLKMSNIFYYSNAEQRNQRVKQVNTQHVKQTDNGNNLVSSSSPIMNVEKGILDTDVKVKFGEIKDPTEFFLVNQYRIQEYQVLKSHLANFYDLPENRQWQPIDPNQYYVFKYLTTGVWFRVQILCQMDDYCKCWWIDEGVTLDIHQSFLFPLDPEILRMAFKALKLVRNPLPLDIETELIPIDITKSVTIEKLCVRFKKSMDDYLQLVFGMNQFYRDQSKLAFIEDLGTGQDLMSHLFILKKSDIFFRVRIKKIFSIKAFVVELLDEGFDHIAHGKDLFLNIDSNLLSSPIHGYKFSLDFGAEKIVEDKYLLNYALQRFVTEVTDVEFFLKQTNKDGQVKVYYQKKNVSDDYISINELLYKVYCVAIKSDQKEDAMDKLIEAEITLINNQKKPESDIQDLSYSSPTAVTIESNIIPNDAPKFVFVDGMSMTMKCKHVFNPGEFYLKMKKDEDFIKFVDELNSFYGEDGGIPVKTIVVGNLYMTNYKNSWTRLKILSVISLESGYYLCLLFDKGIIGKISSIDIFDLDDRFKTLPPRSVRCSIACVKPEGDMYTAEANEFFIEHMINQTLTVYPMSERNGSLHCAIYLSQNQCMMDLLTENGFALLDF